ncbi:LacI family DNA-binding transcriptional regulator [soil metagenome]
MRVSSETRLRIEEAARLANYTPNRVAQQLRGVASKTIGILLDTVNAPVMTDRLFAFEREASAAGYRILVGQTHGQPDALADYANDFGGRGVEALLCLFDLTPDRDARAAKCFGDFERVVFHGRPAWAGGYAVRVDTKAALKLCQEHVAGQGKRRLALSLWNWEGDELMALRRSAFEEGLAKAGREGMVWDAATEGEGPSPEVLDRGIEAMVRKFQADAILGLNDVWATRLILQLQKLGVRVPQDVAVVGYDNLDIASVVSPGLTTIDQNHAEYARAALELVLKVAAGTAIPDEERTVTISPKLIIREST